MQNIFKFFNDVPREDNANPLKDSYHEVDYDVTHRAGGHARYAGGDHIRLVSLGTFALFKGYRLTRSSVKEMEESDKSHVICLK